MDKWCGNEPLCEPFHFLFSISLSKEAWVSDVWNPDGDGGGWTPFFSRAFNDWEVELVEHFLQKIQVFKVQREGEDSDLDNFEVWHLYGQVSLFYLGA